MDRDINTDAEETVQAVMQSLHLLADLTAAAVPGTVIDTVNLNALFRALSAAGTPAWLALGSPAGIDTLDAQPNAST